MLGAVRFRFPVMTLFFRVLTVSAQGTSWGIAIVVLALGMYGGLFTFPMQWRYLQALIAPGLYRTEVGIRLRRSSFPWSPRGPC